MTGMVSDENGWTDPTWLNPGESAAPSPPRATVAAAGKRKRT